MQGDTPLDGHPSDQDFQLHHDAWGRLVLTDASGATHVGVEPVRAFPLSDAGRGISICDAQGHEILWIDRLDDLAGPVRRLLEEHLARREFVPVIRRIVHISSPIMPAEWEVETDRGATRFVINSEDDVHRLDDHRALIADSHGIRYLVRDVASFDTASRRILERYL
jgi:hypothetical protein